MRTILAFVLTTAVFAQIPGRPPDPAIARLEKKVADSTATIQDRLLLVTLYSVAGDFDGLRRNAFWLIENRPEASELRTPQMMLVAVGPPMRETAAMAGDLWRAQAIKPGADPRAIANAAWFLRLRDRKFAWEIVDKGLHEVPADPDLLRTRGVLDVLIIGGVTFNPLFPVSNDPAIRNSPEAKRAYQEIEDSRLAPLLFGAADTVLQEQGQLNDAPAFHDEDPLAAAERWALRAREIAPTFSETPLLLARIYDRQAGQTADPNWKVELYRKADALDPNYYNLPSLATAELEAGDDAAASRDAHRALDRKNPGLNISNRAHTVLGRIALAQGDLATAKAELTASLRSAGYQKPDFALAQDLLEKGERDIVLEFLERVRVSWRNDQGAIDHYIKLVKSPGHPDLTANYRAGQDLHGRQPKLPAEFSGKFVAIQFRNASCKTCDDQFAGIKGIAESNQQLIATTIDSSDKNPIAEQLEVATYPTVVVIGRDGRVKEYLAGNVPPTELRDSIVRTLQGGTLGPQRMPAPKPIDTDSPVKLAWSPVEGAESYIVQLDQRDAKGWISDRDDKMVRVIPSAETSVTLDPSNGETSSPLIRWRVFAVTRVGAGTASDWREVRLTP